MPKLQVIETEGVQDTEIAEAPLNIQKTATEEVKTYSYYETIGYYTGWWGTATQVVKEEQQPPKVEETPKKHKLADISEESKSKEGSSRII